MINYALAGDRSVPMPNNDTPLAAGRYQAEQWLPTAGLPAQSDNIALLARALAPSAYGSARDALPLPDPDSPAGAAVAALLRAGQVPTHRSVLATLKWERTNPIMPKDAAEDLDNMNRWHTRVDAFGAVLSTAVEDYWHRKGYGPTRSEAFESEAVISFAHANDLVQPTHRQLRSTLCSELHRAGWLVSNRHPRSLCTGPTFFAVQHKRSRRRSTQRIGQQVGKSIGEFRFRYHRSPTWSQLASFAKDENDHRIFRTTADAQAQSRWLLTQEWIRIENGEIRRGARAKAATAQRAADRQKNWEQKTTEEDISQRHPDVDRMTEQISHQPHRR